MSNAPFRAGQYAAQQNQPKPHSQSYHERVEIAKGWKAGGGK